MFKIAIQPELDNSGEGKVIVPARDTLLIDSTLQY
jgi:hypothetical protein